MLPACDTIGKQPHFDQKGDQRGVGVDLANVSNDSVKTAACIISPFQDAWALLAFESCGLQAESVICCEALLQDTGKDSFD